MLTRAMLTRVSMVGQRLGPYEIEALLGIGGMGEVYRARDTTLGRPVAIKILPELWTADPDRRARFEREARVLASLNHPNIAAIYGVEQADGGRALVLELVDGDTLADRLSAYRDGLPLLESLEIARQITEGLAAAHEREIVHRDLKPANIKITPEGRVKVLDFGLAKTAGPGSSGESGLTQSPTLTALTQNTVLLGTAPYMSPEQARGKPVDRRTDIWAFGCVLFEMLTGRRAFPGSDVTETLAHVITREPDWHALPPGTPPRLEAVLRRCLQKDPRERLHDISDVRLAMEGVFDAADIAPAPSRASQGRWLVAGLAVGALAAASAVLALRPRPADVLAAEMRLNIDIAGEIDFALSPDGRHVAFVGAGPTDRQRAQQLYVRSLDNEETRLFSGTDGAWLPFWSPDSASIAFFADGDLKRVDIASGFVRTIARAPNPRGGAWHDDGTILFGASVGPLSRVPASGGTIVEATALISGQSNHRWPVFAPGGRQFLLFVLGTPDVRGLYRGSLDSTKVERVMESDSKAVFLSDRTILLAGQGALWAQRLRDDLAGPDGEMLPVAPRVLVHSTMNGWSGISASATGSFTYRSSSHTTQLVWIDRAGRQIGTLGAPDPAQVATSHLTRDDETLALRRTLSGNTDVWLMDRERGVPRRLTFDRAIDGEPVVSPDGTRMVFVSDRKSNVWDMYEKPTDGSGAERLLLENGQHNNPRDWSADGRYLLYGTQNPETDFDLMALPMDGPATPIVVSATRFEEVHGRFSPDGRWVAFDSTESGRSEVYIQPFPGPGPKIQVSAGGGLFPRWPRTEELFYSSTDGRIMSVMLRQQAPNRIAVTSRELFPLPRGAPARFEASSDGQRFLIELPLTDSPPLTIVLNWKAPVGK